MDEVLSRGWCGQVLEGVWSRWRCRMGYVQGWDRVALGAIVADQRAWGVVELHILMLTWASGSVPSYLPGSGLGQGHLLYRTRG